MERVVESSKPLYYIQSINPDTFECMSFYRGFRTIPSHPQELPAYYDKQTKAAGAIAHLTNRFPWLFFRIATSKYYVEVTDHE